MAVVPICITPPSGCPYCACPLGAAPRDEIEVYVKKTPAGGLGVYAIRGRSYVPFNQTIVTWRVGSGARYGPFYARVHRGKIFRHAIYLHNVMPDGEVVGLSPDGYGWLQFMPADIEAILVNNSSNRRLCLY